jgi:hypothetical protein
MKSRALPRFWEMYRELPARIRRAARATFGRFRINPQHPGLHFHRLFDDPRYWSVRITKDYRAVGILEGSTITWIWIGDHQSFDRTFPR